MARITIYLSDIVERKVRRAAKAAQTSMSKWVANQIEKAVETSWSPEFLAAAGSVPDFADIEELRRGYGKDVHSRARHSRSSVIPPLPPAAAR